jgi:hypothetical protein
MYACADGPSQSQSQSSNVQNGLEKTWFRCSYGASDLGSIPVQTKPNFIGSRIRTVSCPGISPAPRGLKVCFHYTG